MANEKSPLKSDESEEQSPQPLQMLRYRLSAMLPSSTTIKELKIYFTTVVSTFIITGVRLMFPIISNIIAGRLGHNYLTGIALANSVITLTCVAISGGCGFAVETILAQIYGEIQIRKRLGIAAQRISIILTLFSLILISIYVHMEFFLVVLGQDPTVAKIAGQYLLVWSPCTIIEFNLMLVNRYLLVIDCKKVLIVSSLIAFVFNVVSQYVTIHVLDWSYHLSAVCQLLSYLIMFGLNVSYVIVSRVYESSWTGIQISQAMQNWKPTLKLLLFGIGSLIASYVLFDVSMFTMAIFGKEVQMEYAVSYNIYIFTVMFHVSYGVAANIRLSCLLGANDVEGAKSFLKFLILFVSIAGGLQFILQLCLSNYLPIIFTNSDTIIHKASRDMIFVNITWFFNVLDFVSTCVIFATARHKFIVFFHNLFIFCVAIPISFTLLFETGLKAASVWIGLAVTRFSTGIVYSLIIYFTKWENFTKLGGGFQSDVDTEIIQEEVTDCENEKQIKMNGKYFKIKLIISVLVFVIVICSIIGRVIFDKLGI